MTAKRMRHPKADKDGMYTNRSKGGRGLIQLETTYKLTARRLDTYLTCNDDPLLKKATNHNKKTEKEMFHCKTVSKIQERTTTT